MSNANDGAGVLREEAIGQPGTSIRLWVSGLLLLLLAIAFSPYLMDLLQLARADDLFSHLPLIPVVTIYLLVVGRDRWTGPFRTSVWLMVPFLALAASCLSAELNTAGLEDDGLNDALFLPVLSLVLFVYAVVAACFGATALRTAWFELAFLLLMIPMPSPWVQGISVFLQHQTADALAAVLSLTQTPFFRDGLVFHLSGLTLEVAPECSGIRSTLVLFITGLLAGHLFLRRPWKKITLVLMVVPLGVLRNAVRITTIALLTIHVDEGVIQGPIHHRGGPFFFALSLVVLFALLFALRAIGRDRRQSG
jgi:exosortase C (VPDSG-CTERM-specific)